MHTVTYAEWVFAKNLHGHILIGNHVSNDGVTEEDTETASKEANRPFNQTCVCLDNSIHILNNLVNTKPLALSNMRFKLPGQGARYMASINGI